MRTRLRIEGAISAYLSEHEIVPASAWLVELPKDRSNGDYASNIAFVLARTLKKSPPVIAADLATSLPTYFKDPAWQGIQIVAVNGFINFILPATVCWQALQDETFAKGDEANPERILLEYVSANPTGPLHIGHGRWAALGDSLARLLKRVGHSVQTEFYVNDAGNQIDKLLASVSAIKAGKPVPDDGYGGAYVKDLVDEADPIVALMKWQQTTLRDFRVEFDTWTREKETLHDSGLVQQSINELKQKGIAYLEEGALFFRSTDWGDDKDRVLVKSTGELTYFAADIAYHQQKALRGYDRLINIWGADHHGYITRVTAGIKALVGDKPILEVLLGQLVTLLRDGVEVRMSKRTGDMVSLQEVIEEIGADAARFFLVIKNADTHLDFDLDLAKKQSNDNPVFYVQYAHARICSILRKSEKKPLVHPALDLHPTELKLLKFLLSFEDEVVLAASRREPHRIANYLIELATHFHSFYHDCKVNVEDQAMAQNRLAICLAVKRILAEGLELLGITAPESM